MATKLVFGVVVSASMLAANLSAGCVKTQTKDYTSIALHPSESKAVTIEPGATLSGRFWTARENGTTEKTEKYCEPGTSDCIERRYKVPAIVDVDHEEYTYGGRQISAGEFEALIVKANTDGKHVERYEAFEKMAAQCDKEVASEGTSAMMSKYAYIMGFALGAGLIAQGSTTYGLAIGGGLIGAGAGIALMSKTGTSCAKASAIAREHDANRFSVSSSPEERKVLIDKFNQSFARAR